MCSASAIAGAGKHNDLAEDGKYRAIFHTEIRTRERCECNKIAFAPIAGLLC